MDFAQTFTDSVLMLSTYSQGFTELEIIVQGSFDFLEAVWTSIIMSHSLLWRHIVLLTVGVYSSNHRVLYTVGISITRRFQKSVGRSVRLSVRL